MDNSASKKLVVYYSLEGNTRFIAEHIVAVTGAELLEIQTTHPQKVSHVAGGIQMLFNKKNAGNTPF
jgi:flavodoxin